MTVEVGRGCDKAAALDDDPLGGCEKVHQTSPSTTGMEPDGSTTEPLGAIKTLTRSAVARLYGKALSFGGRSAHTSTRVARGSPSSRHSSRISSLGCRTPLHDDRQFEESRGRAAPRGDPRGRPRRQPVHDDSDHRHCRLPVGLAGLVRVRGSPRVLLGLLARGAPLAQPRRGRRGRPRRMSPFAGDPLDVRHGIRQSHQASARSVATPPREAVQRGILERGE
jgi:hypothetical protein